jgi:hypothetical protein
MGVENYELAILIGACAFNFCLSMATLLFVFKLWLDLYHKRWFEILDVLKDLIECQSPKK